MNKMALAFGGLLALILLVPTTIGAHINEQEISVPDPGRDLEWESPAVDANDDLAAIVYCEIDTEYDTSELYLRASFNDGVSWGNPVRVETDRPVLDQYKQMYPDVAVAKMEVGEEIIDMIWVTWVEYDEYYGQYRVWVRNFTIDQNYIPVPTSFIKYISLGQSGSSDGLYPRISGSYIPTVDYGGGIIDFSATYFMLVYQQEIENTFVIYYSYLVYDTSDISEDYGHQYPTPCDWPDATNLGYIGPLYRTENPSVAVSAFTEDPGESYSNPRCDFDIVFDYQYNGTHCMMDYGTINGGCSDPSVTWLGFYNFNSNAQTWGYPDCTLTHHDSGNVDVVVWQDSGYAYARTFANTTSPDVTLGTCKDPMRRGISVDMTNPQYYYINEEFSEEREDWNNPGGIVVIWRSGEYEEENDLRGIDSQALEYKNENLRVIHDYYYFDGINYGTDDSYPGYDYSPPIVYPETFDESEKLLDISCISNGDAHVSFQRGNEIWYFTWINYHDEV